MNTYYVRFSIGLMGGYALWLLFCIATATFWGEKNYDCWRFAILDALVLFILAAIVAKAEKISERTRIAVLSVLVCIWGLITVSQLQFYIKTGVAAPLSLIKHAVYNFGDSAGVAISGIDAAYFVRAVIFPFIFVFAFAATNMQPLFKFRLGRLHLIFVAVLAIVLVALGRGQSFVVNLLINNKAHAITQLISWDGNHDSLPTKVDGLSPYSAPVVKGSEQKLNIIILVLESTRHDALNGKSAAMPFAKSLANDSLNFLNAYTTTSHTSKALVGILCGVYPNPKMQIVESENNGLPALCAPALFNELGYRTYFLQTADGNFENRRGLLHNLGYQKYFTQSDFDPKYEKVGYFGMDDRALVYKLRDIIRSKDEKPLFITLLTSLSHHPYALPGGGNFSNSPKKSYLQSLIYTDEVIREIHTLVGTELGWKNTLLLITGDHGEAFSEHGLQQHDIVSYQEVTKIPLLLYAPSRIIPQQDKKLRQHLDILPTLLDLTRSEWMGALPGNSLLSAKGHSTVVTSCWYSNSCNSVVAESGLKTIYWHGRLPSEMYDLNIDPEEKTNIVSEHSLDLFAAKYRLAQQKKYLAEIYRD